MPNLLLLFSIIRLTLHIVFYEHGLSSKREIIRHGYYKEIHSFHRDVDKSI